MLYVVTTTVFDGAPTFGVFTDYELAVSAINEYVNSNKDFGVLEGAGSEYFVFNKVEEFYETFNIETCYPNVPLV